jgi:succinoglycan biosynthesis protein ExoM
MHAEDLRALNVDICIITFRRPEGLARSLSSINNLTFRKVLQPEIEILVVDNDAGQSAKGAFMQAQEKSRWKTHYVVEARRGIPMARNAALISRRKVADFVVLIDDDEVPEPKWLDELLFIQRQYMADIVLGKVTPHFIEAPPRWVEEGGYYAAHRHRNGEAINYAYAGNVLISCPVIASMLDENQTWFDEHLALRGGEDAVFFHQAAARGCKIVWAEEAVVAEWLPASKVNGRWILLRAFRTGQTDIYIESLVKPPIFWKAEGLLKGSARLAAGIVLLVLLGIGGLFSGPHIALKPIRTIMRGAGMIAGALGYWYEEYRRTHPV